MHSAMLLSLIGAGSVAHAQVQHKPTAQEVADGEALISVFNSHYWEGPESFQGYDNVPDASWVRGQNPCGSPVQTRWKYITCDDGDRFGRPSSVQISGLRMRGRLWLNKLPDSVRKFVGDSNKFHGRVALKDIPRNLEILRLSRNWFTADQSSGIYLKKIPKGLKVLDLSYNRLTGGASFTRIGTDGYALEVLDLRGNKISGVFDLARLPKAMRKVHLVQDAPMTACFKQEIDLEDKPFDVVETDVSIDVVEDNLC